MSIKKREVVLKNGQRRVYYDVRCWVNDSTGERRQHHERGFRRKADAEAREAEIRERNRRGQRVLPDRRTVGELLQDYLATARRQRLAPSTLQRYRELAQHLAPLGPIVASRLDAAAIDRLYGDLLNSGLSGRTVLKVHWVLHAALGQALRRRLLDHNVADDLDPPRPDPFEARALTEEEIGRLLDAAQLTPLLPLIWTALDTGARSGELVGLRWSEVDLETCIVYIAHSVRRIKGQGVIEGPTKTHGSKRALEVHPQTVSMLRAHRLRQLEVRMRRGDLWQDLDLVFPTETGSLQDPSEVSRAFKKIAERAGFSGLRFHDLRHTSASQDIAGGEQIDNVSRRLGHSSITTTVNTYAHRIAGPRRSSKIGAILDAASRSHSQDGDQKVTKS